MPETTPSYPKIVQIMHYAVANGCGRDIIGLDDYGQLWKANDVDHKWIKILPSLADQLEAESQKPLGRISRV